MGPCCQSDKPGLQNNEMQPGPFDDVSSYGLVLNPGISNLQIVILGIGFDVLSGSTFSILGDDCRLLSATDNLRSAGVDMTFNGIDRQVAREIDLVLAVD
jgi:hypothetical protein